MSAFWDLALETCFFFNVFLLVFVGFCVVFPYKISLITCKPLPLKLQTKLLHYTAKTPS